MRYQRIVSATFLCRPNRFVAQVTVDGREETVHVKNTGRCGELLLPGATVLLSYEPQKNRKTRYDLIAVEKKREGKPPLLINMDSQAPNAVAEEWLRSGTLFSKNAVIRREVRYGASRFDFYVEDGERRAYLEVKGVTLEQDGVASFPDAPTVRGAKHVRELMQARECGYEAYVLFVIQMKGMQVICPNDRTDPAFGEALRQAAAKGVEVIAIDCLVERDALLPSERVRVDLTKKA